MLLQGHAKGLERLVRRGRQGQYERFVQRLQDFFIEAQLLDKTRELVQKLLNGGDFCGKRQIGAGQREVRQGDFLHGDVEMVSPTGNAREDKILVWRVLSDSSTQILFIPQIGTRGLQADGCREIKKVFSRHDSAGGGGHLLQSAPYCVDVIRGEGRCAIVWLEDDAAWPGRVLRGRDS